MANHNRLEQFGKIASDVRVAWLECSARSLLLQIEAMLIKQFNPELNGESPSTTRPRVKVTLSEDIYQILSEWASQEERTLAILLSYLAANL